MTSKKQLIRSFQLYGMILRADAAGYLCELLEPLPTEDHHDWIEAIVDALQKIPVASDEITKEAIHRAAQEVGNVENTDLDNILEVIDAFRIPKLIYKEDKVKFLLEPPKPHDLYGDAADKTKLFMHRYSMIHNRIINHKLFRKQTFSDNKEGGLKYSLIKIVHLLGSNFNQKVIVLGLLTKLTEDKYHLEDDTGYVEVDVSKTKFHIGLFTINSFVLVEGWLEKNTLNAENIGMPPPELPSISRDRIDLNENYFGGSKRRSVKRIPNLLQLEQENREAMFVVLSDVWLDKFPVMEKLRVLFSGYASYPPTAFILIGNFFSKQQGNKQINEVRKSFGALGNLIAEFPELVDNSKFIFVPGPTDLGPSGIFPRPPILQYATELLRKAVPSASFTTNPCRMVYCTQEIVILREDMMNKMCRNCIHFPSEGDVPVHIAQTLVNQGHLSPLSLHVMPVYWTQDHCMMLFPTPDLIILADKDTTFSTKYNEATIFSPGSFMTSDFSFKVYYPAKQQVENSQIREEEER